MFALISLLQAASILWTTTKKSPVLNLLAEDCLDKVEHGVDKGGQVDVVDPLVPHGNAHLAQVDHSPQLQSINGGVETNF